MRAIRGIIFDCDGVLFESRRANLAYYNAVLADFGESPVREEERERALLCHTAASPVVFETLLGPSRVGEAMAVAEKLDYRRFIPCMSPEPQLAECLAQLSNRLPLAVATNRGTSMAEILRHFNLEDFFSAVVTSRDVPRPKPYPDMLLEAAARLGLAPGELLFVGDSELDRRAAESAGISFVAYRWKGWEGDWSIQGHRDLCQGIFGMERGGKLVFGDR